MICTQVKSVLIDYVDKSLDDDLIELVEVHVRTCAYCAQQLACERLLKNSLRQLPAPPMSPTLKPRITARINTARKSRQAYAWFGAGFSSALTAGIAAWILLAPAATPIRDDAPRAVTTASLTHAINLSLSQVQSVQIALDSPGAIENVELTLFVPDHVEIDGFPGETKLTWRVSLSQGRNILKVPLIARQAKSGTLVAQVRGQEKVKTFTITTVVPQLNKVSYFESVNT